MAQQKMEQKRFDELVQDAKDCDPDKKFMAANDLSNALAKDQLQTKDYDKVVSILLTQLNDESSEVQGNSIRCLSKIFSKLQENQIENVAKTIILKVIEDKGEYKDVYATCLKTLINDVPSNYAKAVQPVFQNAVTKMEQNKGERNFEVEEELCDILNILFKKWAYVLSTQNVSIKSLTTILMNNILNLDRVSLKKKSCSCLGSLGLLLPKDEVVKTINTLLENIKKPNPNQLYSYLKDKQIFIIHAISSLSKTVSRKLGLCLKQIVQLIVQNIQEYKEGIEEYDQIIVISEIFELYLGILENLIKNSHDETKDFFHEIIDLCAELINYDPNNTAQIDDQQMEIEDEEDYDYYSEDQDSDECSWRVRRASLQLIETLVKSDNELIKYIFERCISSNSSNNIVSRLSEKNENIRFANFSCLQTIIRSIVIADGTQDKIEEDIDDMGQGLSLVRVKSSVKDFNIGQIISEILKNIENILTKEKKNSQAVQVSAFKLIESVCSNLSRQIITDQKLWQKAWSLIKTTISNKQSPNELKVIAFVGLRKLLKNQNETQNIQHIQSDIVQIFNLCKLGITQEYFKIVSETFRCFNSLFEMINKQFKPQDYVKEIQDVFPQILVKLKSSDIDQEIKQAVLSCSTSMLFNIHQTLQVNQLQEIFQAVSEKIRTETKKIPILKLIKKVPLSISQQINSNQNILQNLNKIAHEVSDFLQKQDRSLRVSSLEALEKIIQILIESKSVLNDQTKDNIIQKSCEFLNDKDTYIAQIALQLIKKVIQNSPKATNSLNQLQTTIIQLCSSQIVASTQSFSSLYEVFGELSSKNLLNRKECINKLYDNSNKDSLNSVSKAICAIILQSNNNQEKSEFLTILCNSACNLSENGLKRQVSFYSLGELGKHINLCNTNNILNKVQETVKDNKNNSDDIRVAASVALGGIAFGNLDQVLPQVIQTINVGVEGSYLMLNALKQIIEHSTVLSPSIIQIIPNLFNAAQKEDESLCNIVSYIVGKVCLLDIKSMKALIIQNLKDNSNNNIKYTTASSFKYFCVKNMKMENEIKDLVQVLLQNIEEKNVRTRTAILKSLNVIAYNIPQVILPYVNKQEFFTPLEKSLKDFQVKEIDFGPFKQKNDEAEPVRNAAFTLIDTAIDHLHYKGVENFEKEIIQNALENFASESSEDIKILRFQIIKKLALKVPLKMTPFLDQISQDFLNVFKPYASKNDGDRAADMIRTGLKTVITLKNIAEDESNQKYLGFWDLVMKTEKFKNIINSMYG